MAVGCRLSEEQIAFAARAHATRRAFTAGTGMSPRRLSWMRQAL